MGLRKKTQIQVLSITTLLIFILVSYTLFEQKQYNNTVEFYQNELDKTYDSSLHFLQQNQLRYLAKKHNISFKHEVLVYQKSIPLHTFEKFRGYCFNISECPQVKNGVGIYDAGQENPTVYFVPRIHKWDISQANILRHLQPHSEYLQVYEDVNNLYHRTLEDLRYNKYEALHIKSSEEKAVKVVDTYLKYSKRLKVLTRVINILEDEVTSRNLQNITKQDIINQRRNNTIFYLNTKHYDYPSHTTNKQFFTHKKYIPDAYTWNIKELLGLDVALILDFFEQTPRNYASIQRNIVREEIVDNPTENESLKSLYLREVLRDKIVI